MSVKRSSMSVNKEAVVLRATMQKACDLLAERKYGNPARSAGHNARLCLEGALAADPLMSGERGMPDSTQGEPWEYWRSRAIAAEFTLHELQKSSPASDSVECAREMLAALKAIHPEIQRDIIRGTGLFSALQQTKVETAIARAEASLPTSGEK